MEVVVRGVVVVRDGSSGERGGSGGGDYEDKGGSEGGDGERVKVSIEEGEH